MDRFLLDVLASAIGSVLAGVILFLFRKNK
jgi:hypothetical protein